MTSKNDEKYSKPDDTIDMEELEGLDKDTLTQRAKDEFSISDEEWKVRVEVDSMITEKTIEDIASINKYFTDRIENLLSGKSLIRSGKDEERWVQKDKAIAGSLLIKSCVSIIGTFANKSMLISGTKEQDFNMQFEDAFRKISDLVLMPHTYVEVNSIRTILKTFKDTFWNLGSILTQTGGNMESYFAALKDTYNDADGKVRSKLGEL